MAALAHAWHSDRMQTKPRRASAVAAGLLGLLIVVAPGVQPTARAADPTPPPAIGSPGSPMSRHLSGDVYGYLPYWEINSSTLSYLDFNALSALSLFSVTWTGTGTLNQTQPGYQSMTGATGRAIIAAAKARGVHVEIAFTTFGLTTNATFFGDPARQAVAIADLRALVASLGVDGVNVDAEMISGTYFPAYATFVANLRAALRADNPAATVSVATNANVSGAQMAKAAADKGADRIFIMGYAYRSAGSSPGAIAPLVGRSSPGGLDIRWTVDRYAAQGVPLGRTILGLPYYGMSWATASASLGAARTGAGVNYFPSNNATKPASLGVPLQYDPGESVNWYAWYDKAAATWRQVFYDTPTSLRPKYAYAISRRLAGVGIWALGYDQGLPGYWDLLKSMFGPPRVTSFTIAPRRTASPTVTGNLTASPGSRVLTAMRFSSNGTSWSAWIPLPAPLPDSPGGAISATYPLGLGTAARDGTYARFVQVQDEGGTISAAARASVVLDRTGPVLAAAPALWYSRASRRWVASWRPAIDATGPVQYAVWYSVNGGAWRLAVARFSGRYIALPVRTAGTHVAIMVRPVDALGNWGRARATRH